MSCQQVPRIAEDPYMFTDSPTTATYFTSPVQKHSLVRSSENVFSRKFNRLNNKPNDTFNSNGQTSNGPIYGKTKLSSNHLPSVDTNSKITNALIENNETSKVQKRTYRRLQSTNSITNTEFKAIGNVDWETLKRKQSLRSLPPQAPLRSNTKKQSSSSNQSRVSRSIPVTFSSVINNPFECIDDCKAIQQISSDTHAGQQQLKNVVGNHSKSNPSSLDLVKGVYPIEEFGGATDKKTATVHFPPNVSTKSNGLSKSKKQPMPEKKAKTKIEICKKVINRRKSVSVVGYSTGNASNETNKQTTLQRIPLKLTLNEIAPKNQINKIESAATKQYQKEWHAPESYIYDDLSSNGSNENFDVTSYTQKFWVHDIPNENLFTREQRLENKRDNLRRQAFQYAEAQSFRSNVLAKKRINAVAKALEKLEEEERFRIISSNCFIQTCSNTALAMTAYCYLHITLNKDQKLFHPCTAKFSDNSQCRIPVFDISHELPLCREHAWKRDNYNKFNHEQKPKKKSRNKTKTRESIQKTKRIQRKNNIQYDDIRLLSFNTNLESTLHETNAESKGLNSDKISNTHKIESGFIWRKNASSLNTCAQIATAKTHSIVPAMNQSIIMDGSDFTMYHSPNIVATNSKLKPKNVLLTSECSSSYENSDESSTVALSDSELINASDGIEIPLGETRLLEEHDLTNVLNQLPEDAFNDLFEVQQNTPYEPTQKEQDELTRALEEVDEQVDELLRNDALNEDCLRNLSSLEKMFLNVT